MRNSLLIIAIGKCNKDEQAKSIVEFLLENGANPNLCDNHGRTPFLMAVSWSHFDIA
jgi:ankyrin repeat protein